MTYAETSFVRLIAICSALVIITVHLLTLGYIGWLWIAGNTDVLLIESGSRLAAVLLIILAWGVGFAVLALLMIVQAVGRPGVYTAAIFLLAYSLWVVGTFPVTVYAVQVWLLGVMDVVHIITHVTAVRFTQSFPRPLSTSCLTTMGKNWIYRSFYPLLRLLLNPRVFWPSAILYECLFTFVPLNGFIEFAHLPLILLLCLLYLHAGYATGSELDRRRLLWILEGVVIFFIAEIVLLWLIILVSAGLLAIDIEAWLPWIRAVSAWLTLACFVMAVFFGGAFDSGMIVRRTSATGIAALLSLVIFVTLETVTAEVLGSLLQLESQSGAILGGIAAALALRPLTSRIEALMDRITRS